MMQLQGASVRLGMWVILLLVPNVATAEIRTWSDSSGQFQVEAELVSQDGTSVVLRRSDGQQLTVPLARLSVADQAYIREAAENPFAIPDSSPAGSPAAGPPAVARDFMDLMATPINTRQVQEIVVDSAGEWSPPESTPTTSPAGPRAPVRVAAKEEFFDSIERMVYSPQADQMWISVKKKQSAAGPETGRVVRCTPGDARSEQIFDLEHNMGVMAASQDGRYVLLRQQVFGFGNNSELWLCEVGSHGLQPQHRFAPYAEAGHRPNADVNWASYLAGDRFATLNVEGRLYLWNSSPLAPTHHMRISRGCRPAISADGRYMAVIQDSRLVVLDTVTGQVIGSQETPQLQSPKLSFSPGNQRLAATSGNELIVWNMQDGSLEQQTALEGLDGSAASGWTSPEHLLVGNTLVDVDNQVMLWTYSGTARTVTHDGEVFFLVTPHRSDNVLISAQLPHPPAVAALNTALQGGGDFFVLQEGTPVSLDVSGLPDAGQRTQVEQALRERFEAQGNPVNASAPLRVLAKVDQGKKEEVSYRTFGQIGGPRVYEITRYNSTLTIEYQGQTAWNRSGNNVPGSIRLPEGKTMSEYLREHERPNYDFFKTVRLPTRLQRPSGAGGARGTLGASNVTASGIQ